MEKEGNILFYQAGGSSQIEGKLDKESVWLSLNQIALLFESDKSVINRHLHNIFNKQELERKATVSN